VSEVKDLRRDQAPSLSMLRKRPGASRPLEQDFTTPTGKTNADKSRRVTWRRKARVLSKADSKPPLGKQETRSHSPASRGKDQPAGK
jgi:hypothetical protein